jgi:hypothetical protein
MDVSDSLTDNTSDTGNGQENENSHEGGQGEHIIVVSDPVQSNARRRLCS